MQNKIAVIGECMLEVGGVTDQNIQPPLPANLSFGGDTLNTAVYLSRMGVEVDYITGLGDDVMSSWMLFQWQSEGVGCELVERFSNSVPGLYMIRLDESGERSFLYWRKNSPAARLFDDADKSVALFEKLMTYKQIYLTGISLAIYSEQGRQRLLDFLQHFRANNGQVIFDGNYRPGLWPSQAIAQEAYKQMYRISDVVLPTDEDEEMLFGTETPEQVLLRLQSLGVAEIVLKMGPNGCFIASGAETVLVPSKAVIVVDSTAAGDSFNAGFIASKNKGQTSKEAALVGHQLASRVIQHKGAIIPVSAMPVIE